MPKRARTSQSPRPGENTSGFKSESAFSRLWGRIRSLGGRNQNSKSVRALQANPSKESKRLDYYPDLPVNVIFDPFIRVGELGRWRNPSSIPIQTGTVGFATHNWDPFDHDSLPEVYLDGEAISKNRFRWHDRCVAAELAEQPGRFWFRLTAPLLGISRTENDLRQ